MKSSNLAWRIDTQYESQDPAPAAPPASEPRRNEAQRVQYRPRFERRTIEIRDQGFAPFRVR